jgi:putative transposase
VKNQRLDHARKLAKDLFSKYDVISHEDLQISNMMKGNLSKSIQDASWNIQLQCLAYKAEEAGKLLIGVNPNGTSQKCSGCGERVPKGLAQRTHSCPHCGLVLDRDHNAAINIHTFGLSVKTNTQVLCPQGPALVSRSEAPIFRSHLIMTTDFRDKAERETHVISMFFRRG